MRRAIAPTRAVVPWILLSVCGAVLAACGAAEAQRREALEGARSGTLVDRGPSDRYPTEGLLVDAFDLSGDNTADLWKLQASVRERADDPEPRLRLVRKEVDSNFDGEVDIWFHYNARELLVRQESDADFDGTIDLVEYYEAGHIVRREVFRDGSSVPSAVRHYREGRLIKIESDSDGNGTIDTWEIYSLGQLVQVGHDRDGDGKVDFWDDYARE